MAKFIEISKTQDFKTIKVLINVDHIIAIEKQEHSVVIITSAIKSGAHSPISLAYSISISDFQKIEPMLCE